ncbi:thioredoxin-domain-containing protein [Xylona heveae TC161]|uniref:protein disulfide-isomerase n=1 Tax=Xylona heveae (strain CBS 132557 / TC161) TaxID=1328760 RepID=A0A165JCR7_XYLHT|nr:thioredoxin-domain-containing protein [Xylona heveae TC161]KZF26061.1 thioredoxin-domain-containing protein [Xylona heveae TC161]
MFAGLSWTAAAAALLLALPASADSLYTKSSPVLRVDAKNYDQLIARSNHTSIIEFYAPWCGHCQNLKPAYEKAARNLQGLAKVAAVNCDDESNQAFCGSMGIQGFPSLKIVVPSKKAGRPSVEDYMGARSAKAIVDAVVDRIPNHVKRIGDKSLDSWLKEGNSSAKAILFTEKGTTSALIRALAVDFLGNINFAQIRNKGKGAVSTFGVSSFPTLVLLPGGEQDAIVYNGEMKKGPITEFLSQIAQPNPDPAPKKAKASNKAKDESKAKKKASEDSAAYSSASASHLADEVAGATSITLEESSVPTESPEPGAAPSDAPKPVDVPDAPEPLPTLETSEQLRKACLGPKTGTCILALVPAVKDSETVLPEAATVALGSLSEVAHKHKQRHGHLFPFYALPVDNADAVRVRDALSVNTDSDVELIALNGRRSWFRRYVGEGYGHEEVEKWVDAIRLGEGKKEKLPEGLVETEEQPETHDEL